MICAGVVELAYSHRPERRHRRGSYDHSDFRGLRQVAPACPRHRSRWPLPSQRHFLCDAEDVAQAVGRVISSQAPQAVAEGRGDRRLLCRYGNNQVGSDQANWLI